MARATGKAAGVSAKEKRETRPPGGAVSTGTRRQKEKGPRAMLPSSRRARPVGVVRGEAKRVRKDCEETTAEAALEACKWHVRSQASRSKRR